MHKIMYRAIQALLVLFMFSNCNSSKEGLYVDKKFDIINISDTSMVFYGKHCIVPYEIFKKDNVYNMNSMGFYCRKNMKDYNVKLNLDFLKDTINISSVDSCFINFFGKSKSKFVKMDKLDFDFEWDKIKIRDYDNFDVDTSQIISRNKIPEIQLAKLWIISNPGYKLKTDCTDCFYTTFIFYNKDEIVLKKTTSLLPCWYIIIE